MDLDKKKVDKSQKEEVTRPLLSEQNQSIPFGAKISGAKYTPSLPASSEVSQTPPYSIYGSGLPTGGSSIHGAQVSNRPYLTSQPSIISTGGRSAFLHKNSVSVNMQQGVDENIYHWKVLNLSRAKLKASSRTSALLSGFAMVAMVEIQIDKDVPEALMITFAVFTVLLIAVHMLALMISTCILPNVEAVANLHFQTQKTVFESPHSTMTSIVELAWIFSTVLGILLFLIEIAILCWVKFYSLTKDSKVVAWVATGILIPIFFIFIAFAAHFYVKLVSHKANVIEEELKELEGMRSKIDLEVANHEVDEAHNGGTSVQMIP